MREAADTIEEFNVGRPEIYHPEAEWGPTELRREAEHVEAEDREAAERELLVEELSRDVFNGSYTSLVWPNTSNANVYRKWARAAVENGWHK
jgi:hypothetical protein